MNAYGGERGIINDIPVVYPFGASFAIATLFKFAPGEFVEPGVNYRGFESQAVSDMTTGPLAPLSYLAEREGFEPSIRY